MIKKSVLHIQKSLTKGKIPQSKFINIGGLKNVVSPKLFYRMKKPKKTKNIYLNIGDNKWF